MDQRAWRRAVPGAVAAFALAIVALNLLDIVLTLRHTALGAVELNPLMRELLEEGPAAFAAGKHFLVGAAIIAVVGHCAVPLARAALRWVALPAYALTAVYQLGLVALVG